MTGGRRVRGRTAAALVAVTLAACAQGAEAGHNHTAIDESLSAPIGAPPDASLDAPPDASIGAPPDASIGAPPDASLGAPLGAPPDAPLGAPPDASLVASGAGVGEPDVAFGGPQGNIPQFIAECAFSHSNRDDPIVFPGQPGVAHLHAFFGAVQADAVSTAASLLASDTLCDQQLDHSSYWAPALIDHGEVIQPDKVTAYYRPGPGVEPTTVMPYPLGLKMIAGAVHDGPRPSTNVASWTCGVSPRNDPTPPDCPPDKGLRMIVTFPDCWDGTNLDSPDHRSHVIYSAGGNCPSTHSVAVPQLTTTLAYPITGTGHELSLSSGGIDTLHVDFFNAWDVNKLRTEVESCLHREVVCGVTSTKT